MEFLDEFESRPRFLFQSKNLPQSSDQTQEHSSYISSLHKPTLFISLSFSLVIFNLACFYFNSEPLKYTLLWISFSLFLGPFAPPSLTAGDIRVGLGPLLKETPKIANETNEKFNRKSTKPVKKQLEDPVRFDGVLEKSKGSNGSLVDLGENESSKTNGLTVKKCDEREWSEGDDELLRKLMAKHPVGKPGRWEAIAEGYKGKYKVEFVIMKAKEMGERKVSDQDSYKTFLKNRKAVDKRVIEEGENENGGVGMNQNDEEVKLSVWNSVEDLALLNALKAFPKDVAMRWEKIAASVPGKTKAACMKRVTELKKDFRSSKAT